MKKELSNILILLLLLTSCSTWTQGGRSPASSNSFKDCKEALEKFSLEFEEHLADENYSKGLLKSLYERELIKKKTNRLFVKLPGRQASRYIQERFISKLKNWNDNKYPTFFMFGETDSTVASSSFFISFLKNLSNDQSTPTVEQEKLAVEFVKKVKSDYSNGIRDVLNIVDERVSLSYNIEVLKALPEENEETIVTLFFKEKGNLIHKTYPLSKASRDKEYVINQLKKKVIGIDGGAFDVIFNEGRIKQRLIQQAVDRERLKIILKELKYALYNIKDLSDQAKERMEIEIFSIENLINIDKLRPSSFGRFILANRMITKELATLPKSVDKLKKVGKINEVIDQLPEEDKKRLRFYTDGISKFLKLGTIGTIGTGGFTGLGTFFYDLYKDNENQKYACVTKKSDDDFINCFADYVIKTHPTAFAILSRVGNFKDTKEKYSLLPDKVREKYMPEMEKFKRLRLAHKIIEERTKRFKGAIKDEMKIMLEESTINEEELISCARVTAEFLEICIAELLVDMFPGLWKGQKDLKNINVYDFESIPSEIRPKYQAQVEEIIRQWGAFQEYENTKFVDDMDFIIENFYKK